MQKKYTDEQIAFIKAKPEHVTWKDFTKTYNKVFQENRTQKALAVMRQKNSRLWGNKKTPAKNPRENPAPYTEEQKLWLQKAAKENILEFNSVFNQDRSWSGLYQKWLRLKEQPILTSFVEENPEETQEEVTQEEEIVEEAPKRKFARTRHHWTPQEELEVLVNFYSLSVDEARDKFQRPYTAIAKRLEQMVDMTEPHHEALLMEAAKIINQQKAMMRKPNRKERRMAKRMAKIAKKQERLARKMGALE